MQRALLAGLLVAVLAGYFGVFIVQRKMSFLGTGLAHSAFGGVALGLLLGVEPIFIAAPFTILSAIGMTWVRNRTQLSADTAVGIIFAVTMALGIVFLALRQEYASDAFAYLFGSILTVTVLDVWVALGLTLVVLFTIPLWGRWSYASFDCELARADRLSVNRDDYMLSILIACTVLVAVKVLGVLLVTAFLIIPAASARMVAQTFFTMTILSICLGLVGVLAGLTLSYHFDLPSGATIVLTQAVIFFACIVFGKIRKVN